MRKELINAADKYQMNWIEGATEWGTVKIPSQISVDVCCQDEEDIITEKYLFTNIIKIRDTIQRHINCSISFSINLSRLYFTSNFIIPKISLTTTPFTVNHNGMVCIWFSNVI